MRAAIYCRISEDRVGGGLGVSRQEADCRALAGDRGWKVVAVDIDNDISASRYAKKPRPGWERLRERLKASEVDVVVAWHNDRMMRRPRDLEDLIDLLEVTGATVATVMAGDFDLGTADGRLRARLYASIAAHEAEHNAERIRRANAERAAAGLPTKGGSRPFGYDHDKVTVRLDEAAVIREMADRFLAGATWGSLVRFLDERGIPTANGGIWEAGVVKRILCSPRIAGVRAYTPAGATEAIEVPATWPGIITTEQLAAIRYLAADKRRQAMALARFSSRYLLSGMVFCGACGARMSTGTSDGNRRYTCARQLRGCARVTVQAHRVEGEVLDRVFVLADQLQPGGDGEADRLRAELDRLDRELDDLESRYHVDGTISRVEFWAQADRLRTAEREARVTLAREAAVGVRAGPLRDRWEAMGWDEQRDVLRRTVDRVWVARVGKSGQQWRPERVTVDWLA